MADGDDKRSPGGSASVEQEPKGPNAPPRRPISFWEEELIGKRLVSEDASSEANVDTLEIPIPRIIDQFTIAYVEY